MSLSSYRRSKGHAPGRWLAMLLVATLMLTPHLAWGQDKTLDETERLWAQGQELLHKGDPAGAENLFKRALAINEKALGPDHPGVATSLNNLALLYKEQGRYADAEPLYKRALAIREKALGPDHPDVATSLNNLGEVYRSQGRYSEAEPLSKLSLAIREKTLGPDHPDVANSLNGLALLYVDQGRYSDAEPLYKRSLAIHEKALGPGHPLVATSLNNLALLYRSQGRTSDAELLYKRALAILEKAFGPNHPDVATSLNNLGDVYRSQGRYSDAEPLYKRSIAIRENALGPDHPFVAWSLNNLATLCEAEGRYSDAEPLYKRSLAIHEKALGPGHPHVATSLNDLAELYLSQGRYSDAEPLLKRALAIFEKALGPDHPNVAQSLHNLARNYQGRGLSEEALGDSRRSVAIRIGRIERGANDRSTSRASERKSGRDSFIFLLSLLAAQSPGPSGPAPEIVAEAFQAAQYSGGIETARALAGMAARFAAGSGPLAELVRQRQDLQTRWQALDGALVKAVSQPPDKRNADGEAALRKESADVDSKLLAADGQLRSEFPRFAELASAKPVALSDVQAVLDPDESLIAWTAGDAESYAFVVRKDRATFFRAPLKGKDLAGMVASLRDSLDRRGRLQVEIPPFDMAKAYALYQQLLAPAENLLAGAKSLIIVPDGALQSLPPSVLVTEMPQGPIANVADYKPIAWLARRYALTVLPAVSSLTSLRHFADARHAGKPFVGFGDPDFKGAQEDVKDGKREDIQVVSLFGGGAANVDRLRYLPPLQPLPDTANELRAEAQVLGAPPSSVYLRKDATVTKVKSLDLSDVRVVAFATHGLVAGDLPALAEPVLALTPPAEPTKEDDGLLRASDVSQLKLNADWVVLSACNTAAADGTPGAEGLSGLAKAFFHAGARSLLVSHWPVDSAATVKLTTSAFRALESDPTMGRAEAFRRAMLEMVDGAGTSGNPAYNAHPLYWAPFVVVGEGGSGR